MEHRRACNPNGRPGSFYDARSDRIIEHRTDELPPSEDLDIPIEHSRLFRGEEMSLDRLLDGIEIEEELQLSLLLNLTEAGGIAAVLNQSHQFDDNTRILYYTLRKKIKNHRDTYMQRLTDYYHCPSEATHRITSVEYGINLVIIWQLPLETKIELIERTLDRIHGALSDQEDILSTIDTEQQILVENNVKSTIYSNIERVEENKDITSIFRLIDQIRKDLSHGYPARCSIVPKDTFLSLVFLETPSWISFGSQNIRAIRNEIPRWRNANNHMGCWNMQIQNDSHPAFGTIVRNASEQFNRFKTEYDQFMEEIKRFIMTHRGHTTNVSDVQRILENGPNKLLLQEASRLFEIQKEKFLKRKPFVDELRQSQCEYQHVSQYGVSRHQTLDAIEDMLFNHDSDQVVLCANDNLRTGNPQEYDQLRKIWQQERVYDPTVRLVYMDFTDSKIPLEKMSILPSYVMDDHPDDFTEPTASSAAVNVLLLGETGVGKSTFINAFRNYLQFSELDDAERDPIVVIPVSFILATGFDFTEHLITFGQAESVHGENFNDVGQSVTQRCKEHLFDLSSNYGKQLRIIDTPGFNDTRGLKQDRKNMREILRHLHTRRKPDFICLLLKPNEARSTIAFRSAFKRFASIIDNVGYDKIIFCFTNTRATFYAPGNTGPMLKHLLNDLSLSRVPFSRKNTFCFDSESFRYLVAKRNGIAFDDEEKDQYRGSWKKSFDESHRLVNHIMTLSASSTPSDVVF